MTFETVAISAIPATDWLMPLLFLTVWWALRRARIGGSSPLLLAVPLVIALAWGALWSYWPVLAAHRLDPLPAGQGLAILTLIIGSLSLMLIPRVRTDFRTADAQHLIWIGPWRLIFGAMILVIGLGGALPPAFYQSVALGDIAVGVWAIGILLSRRRISHGHLVAWNLAGAADLAHALVLGAIHLRPFYLGNPSTPPLNLLPLAGVPVLLVIHILTLWGLWARVRMHRSATAH